MENNNENQNTENNEVLSEAKPNNDDSQNKIMSAIIIAGVLIAGAILLKGSNNPVANTNQNNTAQNENNEFSNINIREVSKDEHILGNPNAPIKIVEYSDTECPFCKQFHATMHRIVEESDGQVAWVYRHFPIPSLHPTAFSQSIATECAWEQGGNETFWAFTDQIYARTKSNNTFSENDLVSIARDINLDISKFNECTTSEKYAEQVERDIVDGQIAGVRGTPSSFILENGKIVGTIPGAAPYESLKAQVNLLLLK
jgi:protein-disulfide isomerase